MRTWSGIGFVLGVVSDFAHGVGISAECVGDSNAENHVCTLGITMLGDVLPFFFVCVFLRFGPRGACGEVKDARVRGPGESMDFFFALRNRERLAAGR